MNTNLEQPAIRYVEQGDYFLPALTLPDIQNERSIGIWGQRHKQYLKEHHRVLYYNLLTGCRLHEHLADVNEQAEELFSRLVKQLAEKEEVTEKLKSENQMMWVQRMNSICNRATEIVNAEVIYA